jgi:2-octaprenyl-6-methoxyphenol hydroxylase
MTPNGPFAVLPHQGERCGLVWCVPHDEVASLLELSEPEFLEQASRRFGNEIGPFIRMGRRSAYPLRLVVPEHDTFRRGVLVGNAAHVIHPAGAQGFNLGLRDVAVLAEVLSDHGAAGADPGDADVLAAYSRWRAPDREATTAWTDELAGLFASEFGLSMAARSLGLLAHAWLPSLRRRLAIRAMGYRGRSPRLALGESLVDADRVNT